jgi:hypothetical protein
MSPETKGNLCEFGQSLLSGIQSRFSDAALRERSHPKSVFLREYGQKSREFLFAASVLTFPHRAI